MTHSSLPTSRWQAIVTIPKLGLALFEEAFAAAESVTSEPAGDGRVRLSAVYTEAPNKSVLEATLAIAAAATAVPPPSLSLAPLENRDWVAEGLKHLDAVAVGRVRVRGNHIPPAPRAGRIELVVEAATAFGTGHHATTAGCLAAMQRTLRSRRIARALDMGCGTGVLAMALARLGVAQVMAADVDPVAVAVTRQNARANRVGHRIRAIVADNYSARLLRATAPFDLVVANILARPLVAMAPDLAKSLAPNGVAILSGLLASQQRLVLNAHRACGLILTDRQVRDGWATLTLTNRASQHFRTGPEDRVGIARGRPETVDGRR